MLTLVLGNGMHKHHTPILPEFLQYLHGEREGEREDGMGYGIIRMGP